MGFCRNILISSSRSIAESTDPKTYSLRLKNDLQLSSLFVPPPLRSLARLLIETGCVVFGNYKLKSGEASSFYVDLRRLTGHPRAFRLATDAMSAWTTHLKPQAIAAIPMGVFRLLLLFLVEP